MKSPGLFFFLPCLLRNWNSSILWLLLQSVLELRRNRLRNREVKNGEDIFWILLDSLKSNPLSINPAGKGSVCFRNAGFILAVDVEMTGTTKPRHPLLLWSSLEEVRTTLRARFPPFLSALQRSCLGTPSAPAFCIKSFCVAHSRDDPRGALRVKHLHEWCQELFSLGMRSCSHKQLDKFSVGTCVELGCARFVLAEVQVQLNEIQMGRTPTNCHSSHLPAHPSRFCFCQKLSMAEWPGTAQAVQLRAAKKVLGFTLFVCFSVESTVVS